MIEAWRIDSIDARAGLAFASWRASDLEGDSLDLARPAVFLSPPQFQPEAVTNRAPGFSAARGQAQLGVWTGGAELAFRTLDQLTEFVRRAYLTGGSGDAGGGGGDGGGPPPMPDEPRFEVPGGGRGIEEGAAFEHPAMVAAISASSAAGELGFNAGAPVGAAFLNVGDSVKERASLETATLVNGATEIVLELLRRFPAMRSEQPLEAWSRSAQALGAAISRMELWADIIDGPYADDLGRIISSLVPDAGDLPPDWRRYLVPLVFGAAPLDWMPPQDLYRYFDYLRWRGGFFASSGFGHWNDEDAVDQLALWPVPDDLKPLALGSVDNPSAYSLMCSVLANPSLLAETFPLPGVRAWSIVVLAAAHLIAEGRSPTRSSWLIPEARHGARHALMQAATGWIFHQWPRLIFPEAVELAIRDTAAVDPGAPSGRTERSP